jgi:hypothetical protein
MVPSYEVKLNTMPKNKTKIKPRIPFEPDYAVAPGRTLLETIETLGIGRDNFGQSVFQLVTNLRECHRY